MKVVLQDGIKDCGVCCLLSVIRYYGGEISKEYLRELTNTTRSGVSAYKLIEAAEKVGFQARGMKGDLSKIDKNNLPCLAHFIIQQKYKHFVVVYDIFEKSERVVFMDPARGKRNVSMAEFRLLSSQNFIFLRPKKPLPVISQKKFVLKVVSLFLKKEKLFLVFLSLLTFLCFLFQMISAFHFKYLLDFSIQYQLTKPILFLSCYLMVLYLMKDISSLLRNFLLSKWIALLDSEITFQTYKQILLLPYLYYKNRTTGEIVSRLRDLGVVKNFLAQFFCSIFTDFIGVFVFGFFLLRVHSTLTWCILLFTFVRFFSQLLLQKVKNKQLRKIRRQEDVVNSYLVESLSNVDTIKGGHLEKRLRDRFLLKYKKLLEISYSNSFLEEWNSFLQTFFQNFLFTIILGIGSYLVVTKKLSLGSLMVYQTLFQYFLTSLNHLLMLEQEYHNFKISSERIEDLFTISAENFQGSQYYSFCRLTGKIRISQLTYGSFQKELFHELSFVIVPKEKILLTGASGCGKSTLMKMLMRYIEVPFGTIQIGKLDINHCHLEILRSQISYVTNSEFLFTDTLYHNITLNQEVSEEKFLRVAKIAMVDEMIENDNLGYQKLVEENGFNFSQGERQRIILARTILRKSHIYIFDEAFSQIDVERERKILIEMFDYLKDAIVIVISHRFSQQDLFHRIFKLEEGKINEVHEL